jgi:CRP-like cAMP-binding protein
VAGAAHKARVDLARQLVAERYPVIATELLKPLLHLLSLSREACGGDVDKFLILLVVALRTTEHPGFRARSQAELLSGDIAAFPGLSTNMRSIGDSLNIPRETVRRKVGELVEAGWISRRGLTLHFTSHAYRELAGVREAIEAMAISNFQVVVDLLETCGSGR